MKKFNELSHDEQAYILLKKIENFGEDYESFNAVKATSIKINHKYICAFFDTENLLQRKIALFDLSATPIGIATYSFYNNKVCLDFLFVAREYRHQGIGRNLLIILKSKIKKDEGKALPIYVTPIVLDVPIEKSVDYEQAQKKLEKFYKLNKINIIENAAEFVFEV